MKSQSLDSGDRMGPVDHVNYASNSGMSLRAEVIVKQEKVNEKTKNLSRELKSLAKKFGVTQNTKISIMSSSMKQ